MPARPRFLSILAALVVTPCLIASADTGYRIKIAAGRTITPNDGWITVDEINRPDPEAMCRSFKAVQIVASLNQATQRLEQSSLKHDKIDTLEFDFTKANHPYIRIEIRDVTVTNVRTLDGSRQRVTMRYESCSVKEKKAAPPEKKSVAPVSDGHPSTSSAKQLLTAARRMPCSYRPRVSASKSGSIRSNNAAFA